MESFSAIKFEVLISGVWNDITADVRLSPSPRVSGMGIMGNNIMDRVGDVGKLEFSLDNSASNSAATLGYYTPEGANRKTGWQPGLAVRLYFEYDGFRRYKFYGHIDPDGLTPTAGLYGVRDVAVKASNWMREAGIHTLDLIQYQTNKTAVEVIPMVIGNMRTEPLQTNFLSYELFAGVDDTITFPTVFDIVKTTTKALGELQKITMSDLAFLYIRGDGSGGETLERQTRLYRTNIEADFPAGYPIPVKQSAATDNLLLESGDDLLLEDGFFLLLEQTQDASFDETEYESMEVSYGKNMANRVTMTVYPRSVDTAATTVLYELEEPIEIEAAEVLSNVRGKFRDPNNQATKVNGIEMVTPEINTDYQMFQNADGTGTDYTSSLGIVTEYGTAEAKYKLTNNAGVTAYITKLQARGKGVYIYDTSEKIFEPQESVSLSQTTYGVIPLTIDLPYLDKVSYLNYYNKVDTAFYTGGGLLKGLDYPELSIDKLVMNANISSKNMMAFMFLEPGTTLVVSNSVLDDTGGDNGYFTTPWWIQGLDFEIIDGLTVKTSYTLKFQGRA
jgi:hypothetical protein